MSSVRPFYHINQHDFVVFPFLSATRFTLNVQKRQKKTPTNQNKRNKAKQQKEQQQQNTHTKTT